MENETTYFSATISETSNDINGEVTILVDEHGEMLLDITQTLSNLEQSQEGSQLVIIRTEQDSLNNSIVTYDTLSAIEDDSLSYQNGDSYVVDSMPLQGTSIQDPVAISVNEAQQVTVECSAGTTDAINYLTPVQTTDGQTVFVMDSSINLGNPSQGMVMAENMDLRKENNSKIRRILPKPSSISPNAADPHIAFARKKRRRDCRNIGQSINYEVYLLNQSSVVTTGEGPTAMKMFSCDKCISNEDPVKFRRFEDLSRHYCRIHRLRLLRHASVYCREENCSFKSWRVEDLRQHLNSIHGIHMESQSHNFSSMEEFIAWKTSEEKYSGSKFNRSSGDHSVPRRGKASQGLVYGYYACHRSGTQRTRTNDCRKKKKSKTQGSIKMNGTCTASISLIHDKEHNKISCEYCPTHYGHDTINPWRQNLSKQEKEWILQLLLRGWNSDEIVKTLRNGTITGTSIRMRRVTRQDVFNVSRSHGVTNFERRNPDDSISVKLWVEELRSKSSVLICNPEDNNSLLLLVVMNENQATLAQLHGRIILVSDIPLAWERYHRLITLIALSATDSCGYLLAYAVTDQKGVEALQAVFAAVQAKLGSFQPEFILSENPTEIADAWVSDVEGFPTVLSPPWKVEKEWEEGLVKFVDSDVKREAVKKGLNALLAESDPSKFAAFFQLFTGMLASDESLLAFSRFFASSYADQAPYWARFHPLPDCSSLQQLNVELELIARRCRALKRLDKCIYTLEYIAANQPYQAITEFCSDSAKKESEEMSSMRNIIADQIKTLERTVQACDNLSSLKKISEIIKEALLK